MARIARIEPIAVGLPLTQPMKMAGVEIATAENVLVRIETDTGQVGWGESAAAPNMTGETIESMLAAVRYLAPHLVGAELTEIDSLHAEMDWRMVANHAAKSAIEVAVHDALGKFRGVPASVLISSGPRQREHVPVMWLIGTGSVAGDLHESRLKKAEGFTAYKIKVGADPVADDASRTREICAALGKGLLISADANQAWSTDQALAYASAVVGCGLDFLEQPCRAQNVDGAAKVAAAIGLALGADEGVHSLDDLRRWHTAGAAHGASLKTIKLGGLRPAFEAGLLCDSLGMKVNLACKIAESSIGTAALLQIAAVLPQIDWGVSLSSQYLADDLVRAPIRVIDGHATVPAGPGLGVEVDESKVRQYRLS